MSTAVDDRRLEEARAFYRQFEKDDLRRRAVAELLSGWSDLPGKTSAANILRLLDDIENAVTVLENTRVDCTREMRLDELSEVGGRIATALGYLRGGSFARIEDDE